MTTPIHGSSTTQNIKDESFKRDGDGSKDEKTSETAQKKIRLDHTDQAERKPRAKWQYELDSEGILHIPDSSRGIKDIYFRVMEKRPIKTYVKVDPFSYGTILVCYKDEKGQISVIEYDKNAASYDEREALHWRDIQKIYFDDTYTKIPLRFDYVKKV